MELNTLVVESPPEHIDSCLIDVKMCFFVAAEDFEKQSDFVPVNPTMTHSFTSQQVLCKPVISYFKALKTCRCECFSEHSFLGNFQMRFLYF